MLWHLAVRLPPSRKAAVTCGACVALQKGPDSPVLPQGGQHPPAVAITSLGPHKGLPCPYASRCSIVSLGACGTSAVAAEELVLVAEE